MSVIVIFLLGILLFFLWLCLEMGSEAIFEKLHLGVLGNVTSALAAALPLWLLHRAGARPLLSFAAAGDPIAWLAAVLAAALAAGIVLLAGAKPPMRPAALALSCVQGCAMELAQRGMMQGFFWFALERQGVPAFLLVGIILNTLLWCTGIVFQTVLTKQKFDRRFWVELSASAVFSLGSGAALARTQLILLPMAAHVLERLFREGLYAKYNKPQPSAASKSGRANREDQKW